MKNLGLFWNTQTSGIELYNLLNFLWFHDQFLLRKYEVLDKLEHITTQPGYFVSDQMSLVEVRVSLTDFFHILHTFPKLGTSKPNKTWWFMMENHRNYASSFTSASTSICTSRGGSAQKMAEVPDEYLRLDNKCILCNESDDCKRKKEKCRW